VNSQQKVPRTFWQMFIYLLKRYTKIFMHTAKGKGKVVPVLLTEHHTMKTYWGSGGIVPRVHDLDTSWRWVVIMPQPLYSDWRSPLYPLDRRLGGPQSRFGHSGGEENNSQPPPGIEPRNSNRLARSLVAIPTELSRLFIHTTKIMLI
jgi:hypothetical protein